MPGLSALTLTSACLFIFMVHVYVWSKAIHLTLNISSESRQRIELLTFSLCDGDHCCEDMCHNG